MKGLQDPETAPRNGARFLGFVNDPYWIDRCAPGWMILYFDAQEDGFVSDEFTTESFLPIKLRFTHWTDLPPDPPAGDTLASA